jgi:hypothetical protein
LKKIGKKLQELRYSLDELKNDIIHRNRVAAYVRRYQQNYMKKIKSKMNDLYKKSFNVTYFDCQEIVDQFSSMENLLIYHENKGLNISIQLQKKKIQQDRIDPVSENLMKTKIFVIDAYQRPFWQDYETLYRNKHQENEIFSDTFYEYTLKGLIPAAASKLLNEKIKKLKMLDLKVLKYISYEQEFESMLVQLIRIFERLSGNNAKPQKKSGYGFR